jgi:hypothetical protein
MSTEDRKMDREVAELRRRRAELTRRYGRRSAGRPLDRAEFERRLTNGTLKRANVEKPGTVENMIARSLGLASKFAETFQTWGRP